MLPEKGLLQTLATTGDFVDADLGGPVKQMQELVRGLPLVLVSANFGLFVGAVALLSLISALYKDISR